MNQETISVDDFQNQLLIYRSMKPGEKIDDSRQVQLLDQMIQQKLLVQEARRLGLDQAPQTAQVIKTQEMELRKELERTRSQVEAQLVQLESAVTTRILIEALYQARSDQVDVSDRELEDWYETRRQNSPEKLPDLEKIQDQMLRQLKIEKMVRPLKQKGNVRIETEAWEKQIRRNSL